MRLHSKMIYDNQSLSSLDIPTELLTSTNFTATPQKKRMIAPASGGCSVFVVYTILPAVLVYISIMSGVIYCVCRQKPKGQVLNTTIQKDAKEANTEPVMVTTMSIAADEKTSININDTVNQISADTSDESDSSPGQALSST